MTSEVTIAIRVRPGAARTRVGGSRGDPAELLVAVTAPAADGRANEAALRAVAEALGLRAAQVRLRHGATSRRKVLAVADAPPDMDVRVARLRDVDAGT